ncbi:hypothetical protein [Treponema sp. R80B11-R83G3]
MKKIIPLIFLLLPYFAYSQSSSLSFGNASFFMDTKVMKDGSIVNVGFGLNYSDVLGGEIRGLIEKTSTSEELDDPAVSDSIIVNNETVYELFFLPIQYRHTINENFNWQAGAGLYYEYQESREKGYLDMPILGSQRLNSYTDDFSMHILGPLIDVGIKFDSEKFSIGFSGGIVPVYFLTAAENQRMFPLFDTVNHSQETWGSPYFYLGLDSVLFKYVSLSAKYNYSQLKYEVIDLDYDQNTNKFFPIFPESTVVSQSLMFEASLLIPVGGMYIQIGYGYMLNFYTLNNDSPVSGDKHYFILSARK